MGSNKTLVLEAHNRRFTVWMISSRQIGTVQREKVVADPKETGPPLFVWGSIKAKRLLWAAGFSFEGINENSRYPAGKDLAVIAVNKDCDEGVFVTADDGILLYTKEFATYYGQAVLVERDEDNYWTLIEAAKELCELLEVSPVTAYFGDDAENSPISDILLRQYDQARDIIRRYESTMPKEPTPMQTLMAPLMSMNPLMGGPQQVLMLITQQVPAKEPTVIEDITLDRGVVTFKSRVRGVRQTKCGPTVQ
jgi:hypothetical protein